MRGSNTNNIKLITLDEPSSVHAEMYRTIRTNLIYSSIDKELNVINITSTVADEAKTTTACNLAVTISNNHKNVLIIDLDLRNPSVHYAFNIKNEKGITDLLVDFIQNGENVDIKKYTQLINHGSLLNNLYVIPAGTDVINPIEILSSNKIKELIQFLKKHFNKIILDSSPSGVISDGLITSTIADGTLFVVESGKTKIDITQKSINQLKDIGVNILGVVLTKVKNINSGYYEYGYGNTERNTKDRIKINIE